MRRLGFTAVSLMALLLLGACGHRTTHEKLHGTLWSQSSGEYIGTTIQTFETAAARLEDALRDSSWTAALEQSSSNFASLPPAIIVDIDETILDNSPFQARLVADGIDYSADTWEAWMEKGAASALPGAKIFLDFVVAKHVTIFYVTNRDFAFEHITRTNLARQGLPVDESRDTILTKNENNWGSDKTARRQAVANEYRILLLVGDDLNDFVSGARTPEPASRRELAMKHREKWGWKWILLPNPLYGSWEASLFERDFGQPDDEKLRRKYRHLSPFEP